MTTPDRPFYAAQDSRRCPDNVTGDDGVATRSRCPRAPADGYNPLGRCVEHLRRYRGRVVGGKGVGVGEELVWWVG